jgi:hypothetical protein
MRTAELVQPSTAASFSAVVLKIQAALLAVYLRYQKVKYILLLSLHVLARRNIGLAVKEMT